MAIYHLSASVVKRSEGRSAVAAAAYRSGSYLADERYGLSHDYTRKGGIVHTEILAPENAPDWMRDREQLWNAVEKIETRKNAQLARDITLALPHEMTAPQRLALVRQFALEQFVARGMIADIAIHEPHRRGDDRNHHAHIMLTMRELMGEGFSDQKATPEARKWNERETLEDWRTAWAALQNREFERLGIAAKVDSRSFDAQGIDREPSQHEGPAVTAKRRRGELSEIEQENDRRASANDNTADLHAELLKVRSELARIRIRQHDLAAEKEAELSAEHDLSTLALKQRQEREQRELETYLADHYAPHLKTVQAEAERVTDRLENAGTVRRLFRDMTGRSRADRERLDKLQATIEDAHARMHEQRQALVRRQEQERQQAEDAFKERGEQQRRDIFEAQRQSAEDAAGGGGKLTVAQRLALRAQETQERLEGLERQDSQKVEQTRQESGKGRDFDM